MSFAIIIIINAIIGVAVVVLLLLLLLLSSLLSSPTQRQRLSQVTNLIKLEREMFPPTRLRSTTKEATTTTPTTATTIAALKVLSASGMKNCAKPLNERANVWTE